MEYYIVRQSGGGAVLAARLQWKDSPTLERDVDRIARSVQVTAPVTLPRPVK
jgi:hypothetical protein